MRSAEPAAQLLPGCHRPGLVESLLDGDGPGLLESVQPAQGEAALAGLLGGGGQGPQPIPGHHAVLVLAQQFLQVLGGVSQFVRPVEGGLQQLAGVPDLLGRLAGLVQGVVLTVCAGRLMPMAIFCGSMSDCLASSSTSGGKVAEKSMVCL